MQHQLQPPSSSPLPQPTLLQILFQQSSPHSAAQQAQQAEALSDYSWLQQQHDQRQLQQHDHSQIQSQQNHVRVVEASREERQRQTTIVLQHLFDSSRSLPESGEASFEPREEVVKAEPEGVENVSPRQQPSSDLAMSLFCDPNHPFVNFQLDFSRFGIRFNC
jgi:hypothetical protein